MGVFDPPGPAASRSQPDSGRVRRFLLPSGISSTLVFTSVTRLHRQTVSWLSDAPPVLEECARAATQPQLLKILLQHQMCLGHLEAAGVNESRPSSVLIGPFWCPHRRQEVLGNSTIFFCFLQHPFLPIWETPSWIPFPCRLREEQPRENQPEAKGPTQVPQTTHRRRPKRHLSHL